MASSANIRIAKNTAIIYIRMAVTILVGLITSSLVLRAIGADDVGIYSTVGSTVALISVITGALSATTVRFMNIELGKPGGNPNRMFNICHTVHLWGAAVLLILLETIGLWYIHAKLNVAPGKEADAMFVFQVSTLVACLGIANVPFQSLFTVHERFRTVATVDIANAIVKLLLVIVLWLMKGHQYGLRIYAVMMSVTTWISFIVYHVLSARRWKEIARWKPVKGWSNYREVLNFSNYNLLSSSALVARSQGSNMLINAFFGTTVNAAYYYAATVQNYVNQFIANFDTAAAPQITQGVGAGDRERAISLSQRVSRICLLLFMLLFFPLWSELDFILGLWLGSKMPEGTVLMCRWTLLVAAASATSAGLGQLINAFGRIKWYKIEVSVLYLGCLLAGYLLYRGGAPAHSIIICFVVADLLSRIIQFILLRAQFRFPVGRYLKEAYMRPMIAAAILSLWIFLAYPALGFKSAGGRLIGLALTFVLTAYVVIIMGFTPEELRKMRAFLSGKWNEFSWKHLRRWKIQKIWKKQFGHRIDWKHPRDINEKIQCLMTFSDTSQWTTLSDKLAVREYVKGKGLEHLLVPILGSWERSADIPFSSLPEKFVLKCNHDSGSTHIVEPGVDRDIICSELDKALENPYGFKSGETYYADIQPRRIIAEEFLGDGTPPADYKVWCFHGKPYCIWSCTGRTKDYVYVNTWHTDWTPWEGADKPTAHYRSGNFSLPRPENLEEMLDAAAKLSEGFPEVRVDFYSVQGKLYFGEMTFASLMGRMDFHTPEFLKEMGDQI